jgi:hypothetical protein
MAGIALLGLVFAVIHYLGMSWSLVVIFFLLCVLAHVAGNAMGTRLRDIGSETSAGQPRMFDLRRGGRVSARYFAPATKLREKRSLGKPIVVITALGAVAGGVAGGLGLAWLTEGRAPWPVSVLGIGACVVLGAIWTFVAGSFVQVMLGAWLHAARDPRRGKCS